MEKMILKRQNLQFLEELDDGDGLTKETFIMALLLHFGTIDEERDIKPWAMKFEALDRLKKGRIYRQVSSSSLCLDMYCNLFISRRICMDSRQLRH